MTPVIGDLSFENKNALGSSGEEARLQLWTFLAVLSLLVSIAIFRKGYLARAFFALAYAVASLFLLLFTMVLGGDSIGATLKKGAIPWGQIFLVLMAVLFNWIFLTRIGFALGLSLLPWRTGKILRRQIRHTLQAAAARKRLRRPPLVERADSPASRRSLGLFVALGGSALLSALLFGGTGFLVLQDPTFGKALREWNLASILARLKAFPAEYDPNEPTSFWLPVSLMIIGFVILYAFGFLWHRWRRNRIPVLQGDASSHIPPGSVLLLRHSKDDVMKLRTRKLTLVRLPFLAFDWNFTFEELLAGRLSHIGPLHSLGSFRDSSPLFHDSLETLALPGFSGHPR